MPLGTEAGTYLRAQRTWRLLNGARPVDPLFEVNGRHLHNGYLLAGTDLNLPVEPANVALDCRRSDAGSARSASRSSPRAALSRPVHPRQLPTRPSGARHRARQRGRAAPAGPRPAPEATGPSPRPSAPDGDRPEHDPGRRARRPRHRRRPPAAPRRDFTAGDLLDAPAARQDAEPGKDAALLAQLLPGDPRAHPRERLAYALGWTLERLAAAVDATGAALAPTGLRAHENTAGMVALRRSDDRAADALRRLQRARDHDDGVDNGDARLLHAVLTGGSATGTSGTATGAAQW